MDKSFLRLQDKLLNSGILASQSEVTRQLKMTTEQFVVLSKVASSDWGRENDAIAQLPEEK